MSVLYGNLLASVAKTEVFRAERGLCPHMWIHEDRHTSVSVHGQDIMFLESLSREPEFYSYDKIQKASANCWQYWKDRGEEAGVRAYPVLIVFESVVARQSVFDKIIDGDSFEICPGLVLSISGMRSPYVSHRELKCIA